MGIFNKEKTSAVYAKKPLFDCGISIKKDNWFHVFSASLGRINANQKACAELVVKGRDWNVDFSLGIISFGKDNYSLQFIGSESASSNTWLWGWENVNSFPEAIIELANLTKRTAEEINLEALTVAEFELSDTFNGHNMSVVTCALSDKNYCYYRGPHEGGAIFVAFSNVPNDVFAPIDIHSFVSTTLECIQNFQVDHKIFIESFLYQNDTSYEWENLSVIAHFKQDLKIDFERADEFLRISNIKTL